jgi:hypothetical protein
VVRVHYCFGRGYVVGGRLMDREGYFCEPGVLLDH